MKPVIGLLFIYIFLISQLSAQNLSIGITSSVGIAAGNSPVNFAGSSVLSVGTNFRLKDRMALETKFETAIIPIGTAAGFRIGPSFELFSGDKFDISIYPAVYQGLALFKPASLYLWGASIECSVSYNLKGRSAIQLATGIRHSVCPAYQNYSSIYSFTEIPLSLSYIIRLK